jgi:hypothetical protein
LRSDQTVLLEATLHIVTARREHDVLAPAQIAQNGLAVALQAGVHFDLAAMRKLASFTNPACALRPVANKPSQSC